MDERNLTEAFAAVIHPLSRHDQAARLVTDLLANGPAVHERKCPTCKGVGLIFDQAASTPTGFVGCPTCRQTGKQTVEVTARVMRRGS